MIAEKLRKAVLQAAIHGKLTEQLPEDGDARDLLKEIQQEKARLVKEGKLKKEKPLPPITEDEIPFDIPENWIWVRLGDLSSVVSKGTTPQGGKHTYIDSGIGFVRAENIGSDGKVNTANIRYVDELTHNTFLKRSKLESEDLLICIAGTLGRAAVVDASQLPLNANQAVAFIRLINREIVSIQYLQKAITSFSIQEYLLRQTKVTAIPNLTLEIIKNCLIPLPPIAEQQRIVQRIDIIFPEIKRLAIDERKLEALEKAFPQQLKNAILQAAIQGKLTEQLPEDGDARDLLKQIQQEKASLVKAGKLKKENPLPPITEDDIPFDIPDNWVWVRLGDLINVQTGKKDANWGSASGKYNFYTCAKDPILSDSYSFEGKSIIMPGNGANVGLSYLIDEKFEAYQRTYVLQAKHEELSLDYIQKVIAGDWKRRFGGGVYGSAIPYIRLGEIVEYSFPLPPLAEQQRIVERLEELLPLCEKLE